MKNGIPTQEDFARADAAMRERDRGISDVRTNIRKRFTARGLSEIYIMPSDNDLFVCYLFFPDALQVAASEQSGLIDIIKQSVIDELEKAGRGDSATLNVKLEIDTDENIHKNYRGDYFLRLR